MAEGSTTLTSTSQEVGLQGTQTRWTLALHGAALCRRLVWIWKLTKTKPCRCKHRGTKPWVQSAANTCNWHCKYTQVTYCRECLLPLLLLVSANRFHLVHLLLNPDIATHAFCHQFSVVSSTHVIVKMHPALPRHSHTFTAAVFAVTQLQREAKLMLVPHPALLVQGFSVHFLKQTLCCFHWDSIKFRNARGEETFLCS